MEPIKLSFNLKKIEDIKKLVLVLGSIRGKDFKPKKYQEGVIPKNPAQYLQKLKEKHGLTKEEGFSPKVIQLINQLWINTKYKEPAQIHQLHIWLKALNYEISNEEFRAKIIGETTKIALTEAEQKYDLPITGQLSFSLENRLRVAYNTAIDQVKETELLKINDVNRLQKIIAPLSLNGKGDRVQQLQLALAWLGYDIYKAEYRKALFAKQTRLAVIAYQKENDLEASGKLTLEMAKHLNEKLLVSKPDLLSAKTYRVRGSVKDENWKGIESAKVQVYQQVLRQQSILLGERTTMTNGFYDLIYTPPKDENGKIKEKFHLAIQIQGPDGKLLKTQTIFNASPTTWVNYTAGNIPYQGKSVYEENLGLLTPHLEGLELTEIEESEKNKDVQYLNATSGLGGNEIMLLSLAHRLAAQWKEYDIDASIIYGLFKQQLPLSLPSYLLPDEFNEWETWINSLQEGIATSVALISEEEQLAALQKSIKFNIIPIHQSNELERSVKKLQKLRFNYAEKAPLIGEDIALDTILTSIEKISSKERNSIIKTFSQQADFSLSFIDNLVSNKTITKATERQLKEEYLLLQLGNKSLTLMNSLKEVFNQDGYSVTVTQVSDFAKWSTEDWKMFISKGGRKEVDKRNSKISKVSKGDRKEVDKNDSKVSKVPNLTPESLKTQAVALAPSVATLATLQKSKKIALDYLPVIADVIDQQQWYNLIEIPIVHEIKEQKLPLDKAVIEELKLIQRVEKIATSPEVASILIDNGIHSAHKVLSLGVTEMAKVLGQGGISANNANMIATTMNQFAQQQVGAVLGIGTTLQLIGNTTLPTNVLPELANWEELFGSADTCACEHCRSVYSPAAYLTDLLYWLNQTSDIAQNALLERRPDLEQILLNCQNAHTPLPYVDLVNEVLEYAIIQDPSYIDRNTTWTVDELKLEGEHQLDAVYEQFILASNNSSYKPYASYNAFNLWQSKFHLYLEKLGVYGYELVQSLGKYTSTHDTVMAMASSYFKIPSHETQDIISNYYDYSTHPAASNNVEQFLKHHNLSYDHLIELLQCSYINNGTIQMSNLDECSLDERELIGLNNVHYNKIWRFLRLWKYTGWQLWELNLAVEHPLVGNGLLNETAVREIVRIHQLQGRFEVTLEECLTLFGTMNTELRYNAQNKLQKSLYQKVYLSPLLDQSIQGMFDPDNLQVNLQSLTTEELNYIAVALSTNTTTIQEILNAPRLQLLSQNTITATVKQEPPLSGLSQLYAYTLLLKQFSINVEDLQGISRLLYFGNNFVQNLESFESFLVLLEKWLAQNNTVTTVRYLTTHAGASNFLKYTQTESLHHELNDLLQKAYDTLMITTETDEVLLTKLFQQVGTFPSDLEIQEFLNVILDPSNFPSTYSSLSAYLSVVLPNYFNYATVSERNLIASNITNVTVIKQLLHRQLNKLVVYEFWEKKLGVNQDIFALVLAQNHPYTNIPVFNYLVPIANTVAPSVDLDTALAYQYMYKHSLLVQTQNLSLEEIKALETYGGHSSSLGIINTYQVPVPTSMAPFPLPSISIGGGGLPLPTMITWTIEEWNTTWEYRQFCLEYGIELSLFFAALDDLNTNGNFIAFFSRLEQFLGWDSEGLTTLHNHFGWAINDYLKASKYQELAQIMTWSEQSQESVATWLQWPLIFDINDSNYLSNQRNIATQVQQSLQQVIAANQWQKYQQEIYDKIRVQKRDALVAYTQHYAPDNTPVLLSVNELYKYYLIDPGMSACQYTSRIKQAISSVQLFIQRCLLGLEENIDTTALAWKQWDWMQNYRVWEANRKVFLYPENWIEPTLRDNKSELFKQFEDKIAQNEITNENVELALQEYLLKLHHIANLEIKSICYGSDDQTVHVLARTKENPADYYYRKLDKSTAMWTAWEKIEPAIKGEHPVLQFYNNRVHIFWLEILERPQEQVVQHDNPPTKSQKLRTGVTTGDTNATIPQPPLYKEVQLSWIVLYETGWSPQTLSKQKLIHPWPRPDYSLHLRPRKKLNDLWLDIYVSTSLEFNGSHFYNQFSNTYEQLTTEAFEENQKPWHSSSFVFDGFVREIKLKPINGTYWYVGWETTPGAVNGFVNQIVPLLNSGPIWIRGASGIPLTGIYLSGILDTNYGTFDLAIASERSQFNSLMVTTRDASKTTHDPITIEVAASFISNAANGNIPMFVITSVYSNGPETTIHSIEQLNGYFHEGDINITVPEPMTTVAVATYGRLLVPAPTPDHILKLSDSDSYEYIYHSFGKDGRKIKQLQGYEQESVLNKPDQLHYEYNHIVPNTTINDGTNKVKVLASPSQSVNLTNNQLDYKLTVPLEGGLNDSYRYNNVIWQDDLRSFFLERNQNFYSYQIWIPRAMYHPFTRDFISKLGSSGLDGLYEREVQFMEGENLVNYYNPTSNAISSGGSEDLMQEQVKFNYNNGYGLYNYELFFHIPFLIATELSKNQRFEESMKWFHYIFNPTGVPSNGLPAGDDVSKYWITKPFFRHDGQDYYDSLIQNLLATTSHSTGRAIEAWQKNPFQPHLVARMRPVAYQKAVVMKYIDNLVAWGDQLFRRDTLESINQAALRYIMATEILGDQPNTVASQNVEDKDYVTIKATLDDFANTDVLVQLENFAMWTQHSVYSGSNNYPNINVNVKYFCIPKNEKLAQYWSLVADRMFKIRHCMNIDGVVRQLPLFAPPIDPALLVNAQANGIDLGDVLNDLSLPKTHYKYRALGRLAIQFCSEVKGLGQSLLSALQSKDAEGMALLQAGNALKVLDALTALKGLQIQEAEESIRSLELSREAAQFRKDYYEGRDFMNPQEKTAEKMNRTSITLDAVGTVLDGIAAVLTPFPKIEAIASFPPGVKTTLISGGILGRVLTLASGIIAKTSNIVSKEAGMTATQGSFNRRQEEWDMQAELATKDIEQIEQQITTSKIRIEIAKKDLATHLIQIDNAQSEQEYLQSKYTNQQLYSWMIGQISTIYFQAYQLAFDMAKKAEKSMRYELALPTSTPTMINFGYWDSMKKGLLAGDKLMLALNKMEATYIDKNRRELELTKHISLRLLDPQALLQLKNTGTCDLDIPQWWFDLDYPGHYLRRIKSLSVSIPCIVGPYTTIACTLTMTKNTIQKKDGTYDDFYETTSIATSSAQNDAGVFELNFNGERYLPFEGAGAISKWTLTLPDTDLASFDYQSITDIVLHMNYMAKDGGALMASNAKTALRGQLSTWSENSPVALVSLKEAFPTAWYRFQDPTIAGQHHLNFDIESKHYPYLSSLFAIRTIDTANLIIVRKNKNSAGLTLPFDLKIGGNSIGAGHSAIIGSNESYGDLELFNNATNVDVANWELDFSTAVTTDIEEIEDVFLLLKYELSS